MVGERRAFLENITCCILATILGLYINNTLIYFFPHLCVIDINPILLRTKLRHFEKLFIKDYASGKFGTHGLFLI